MSHTDTKSAHTLGAAPHDKQDGNTRKPAKKRREWPYRMTVMLMVIASIIVTLFPVGATYYNNWHAMRYANSLVTTQSSNAAGNAEWLARARRHNAMMAPGQVSDPWTGTDQTKNPGYQLYLKQLSADDAMARVRIPSIKLTLPVFHGTDETALHRGAGHMFGTSLPVGGPGTHAAIAAHRGLPDITAFDKLPELKMGEDFFVDVAGETLAYRVTAIQTVVPTDLRPLTRTAGKDQVTFITCTPYGVNSHRLLVTGSRIPLEQAVGTEWQQGFDWSIQSWMHLRLGIAALALVLALGIITSWIRQDHRRARARTALVKREDLS